MIEIDLKKRKKRPTSIHESRSMNKIQFNTIRQTHNESHEINEFSILEYANKMSVLVDELENDIRLKSSIDR